MERHAVRVHLHRVHHLPWHTNAGGPMDESTHAGCVLHNGHSQTCAAMHIQQNGCYGVHVMLGGTCQGVNIYIIDKGTDSGRRVEHT